MLGLNVGSGSAERIYKKKEWINIDPFRGEQINVRGDGALLPFKADIFDQVHSIHVLEHLPRHKWPLMLSEMYRVCKVQGETYIEVPDFEGQVRNMVHSFENDDLWKRHLLRTAIWGKSEQAGMGHCFGFDEDLLARAMKTVGFFHIERLEQEKDMISRHFKDGPVILMRGTKPASESPVQPHHMTTDELRQRFWI